MSDHWTAAEYREWQRTGREPAEQRRQAEIEKAWARAEKEGRVRAIDVVIEPDAEPKKPNKYRNRKASRGWKKFASEHEAQVYDEMMARVRAGELKCVMRQVPFDLLEKSRLQYFADFVAIRPDNTVEGVYDAKSEATRKDKTYIVKKKLMKEQWDIEIIEV